MTGNKGTAASGTGTEGSKEGNSSTGAKTGTGGYGTFDQMCIRDRPKTVNVPSMYV